MRGDVPVATAESLIERFRNRPELAAMLAGEALGRRRAVSSSQFGRVRGATPTDDERGVHAGEST